MATEEQRKPQLDPAIVERGATRRAQCGPRAEHDAGREVLDLALAVDRRIRDHRDGLVHVVGEHHRTRRERGQRTVPTERADRLRRRGLHVLRHAQVIRLEAERRELLLATAGGVLELVGRRTDLPAVDLTTFALSALATEPISRDGSFQWPTALRALAHAGRDDTARVALGDEARTHRGLIEEPPPARVAPQGDAFAGAERVRVARVPGQRNEPALAREDVRLVGLDVPQRSQAEGIDAEQARVADAREERGRSL